jgi:hypothetical protein
MFIVALFTIAKLWKQPRSPTTDEWIMKLWYIYTMEYYSATRNNKMGFESKWIQLEEIMLSEVSQDQKHRKNACFPLCREDRSKDKHVHKNKYDRIYRSTNVEHICNSGTTLQNLGAEGKEKRMTEHQ